MGALTGVLIGNLVYAAHFDDEGRPRRRTDGRLVPVTARRPDGTVGWSTLLPQIVANMIRAGTSGTFADGRPKINGVVIGFASAIGRALCMAEISRQRPS